MSDPPQFVCAFRGRRDSYQVPLALAEGDFLDQFITDAYFGQAAGPLSLILPRRLQDKLRSRAQPGIPWKRVKSLWGVTVSRASPTSAWICSSPYICAFEPKLFRCRGSTLSQDEGRTLPLQPLCLGGVYRPLRA